MGVKRSIWFKSLATFLAFIIVIQLLPLSVLAENITQSSASDISNEQNMEVVGEVVDKRTEYQKTYELTDGTYYEITSSLLYSYLYIRRELSSEDDLNDI